MTNIILCGGSGTRLWPISRTLMPKQFVKLFDNKSLFQLTVERNNKLCDSLFIVSNSEQYFLALDQIEELTTHNSQLTTHSSRLTTHDSRLTAHYLLEPIARNTAPAIALACMALDSEEVVLVTPSDHLIKDEVEYQKVVQKAKELASEDKLVTFGITPTFAETGFGYIEAKIVSSKSKDVNGLDVVRFHEKPDLKTAESYLEANNSQLTTHSSLFLWNSGMFCFKAGVFLEELKLYAPDIYESCLVAFENKKIQHSTLRIQHSHMEAIPNESIDYAVMEKSNIVKVVPSDISWSDVGSFDALSSECSELSAKSYEEDCSNNFYYNSNDRKVIAAIGLEDFIVIDSDDALLIAKKGETQKVKNIVQKLNLDNSPLTTHHSLTYRPWGTYTVLEESNGYKIKRIVVQPGKRLSLQKHFHRSEHWIVVSGTATVIVGDEKRLVRPNESTYIKAGELHRLENEGKIPVVLIEAQVGEYTGEDDIVRIEDDFNRES
ncbi:MAG: mannose-1-phosphate guanylyltransferase/mannose-6-phosphate isomerase [Arcobacteraceae bacterium]|nr:mannose-1-phosphate guanylyltransferase/mannose-6-phosphate isomerase [Arcobacteraceae bacterium]